ncbi:carboxypeptidase-like regulatory domain-containing protein [Scytonema millei]|uniref:carboxypeptidase-like regulatory domain-containing protein n=1 Tax=Scytonema millei TaxID=1245922 RepID=UPI001911BE11|nr:carboxypeptidase-like regulatory domain-containing protein [Scytonema millei]
MAHLPPSNSRPTLTVGLGGVYDDSLQALAEVFWRPDNLPLQVAVSALAGSELEAIADIQFTPSPNFSALLSSDRYSSRLNLNWQLSRSFSLYASANSRDATSGGVQFSFSRKNFFTFTRVGLDTKNRLRWYLLQGLGRLELNLQGNEVGTNSALTYNLSQDRFGNTGHSLLLNYETRSQGRSDRLLTLGWQYRSPQRTSDGSYLWEAQLGYGINSGGNGLFASLGTAVLPGVMLRGRYQGVSLTSDESSFSIELVSSLGLQAGISPGDRHTSEFRTQGGLLIQPFFDRNNNHKRDPSEEIYTENCDLLLLLNNQPLNAWRPKIQHNRILLRLPPNTYRLDFDPAGFPPDWQAQLDALAVVVSAGSYTPVLIPLIPAYTRTGVVTDTQDKPIAGATVEAIGKSGQRKFSVTNSAGVYYLEGLSQGEYTLTVNGNSHLRLKLNASTKPFQELNLKTKV